ncbi:hypothetical protein ACHAWF_008583 [Thalassiosira exigua]
MMSLASLSRSLSRRRPFQIRWDRLRPRHPTTCSDDIFSSSFATAPSLPLCVSARSVGRCGVEAKMPRSSPSKAFTFVERWSSTVPKQSAKGKKGRFLDLRGCQSVKAATDMAFERLDELNPSNLSSFWTRISQLIVDRSRMSQRNRRAKEELSTAQYRQLKNELFAIFDKTLDSMREFDCRHLTQLAFGLAKIVREVDGPEKRLAQDPKKNIVRKILLGRKSHRREKLFRSIGIHAFPLLPKFDARCLSNLAYAFAIVGTVPSLGDGRTLFDHVAETSIPLLKKFDPQAFSNMVWAYEKVGASNPTLFEEVAKEIVARDHLGAFMPQHLSNILLAYSKSGVQSSELYDKVANHLVGLHDLGDFKPQDCSNIVWTFAKARESNQMLFQKITGHIIGLSDLNWFKSQNLSNTVWAFATAGESNPRLFQKVADHIIRMNNLNSFIPQSCSNTVWAFAKAGESNPRLFQKVADHIIELNNLNSFSSKDASQILWAYSSAGIVHTALFKKVHDNVEANVNYASLDEDDQNALLRSYQKAEHESTKK